MWRREASVVWEDDGERIWAVHPAVGELVSLSGSAAVVWDWLGVPVDDMVPELAAASGETEDVIRRDVGACLAKLKDLRLVTCD